MGKRISKSVNGTVVEKYLWQDATTLLAVLDAAGNVIQRFEYADGRMPVAMTQGGQVYYLAYDQVGSLRAVFDSAGTEVKRVDYDSFGNILSDSNPTFMVPFGFAGGLHDRNTGLVRFGARDYDPATGKWTAKDPIDFGGGDYNLLSYVAQDPVNVVDYLGLASLIYYSKTEQIAFVDGNTIFVYEARNRVIKGKSIIEVGFHTDDVSAVRWAEPSNAFGPGVIDLKQDSLYVHGGGSCLEKSLEDRQGWCKTEGCIRMQNEDLLELIGKINDFQQRNPGSDVSFDVLSRPMEYIDE